MTVIRQGALLDFALRVGFEARPCDQGPIPVAIDGEYLPGSAW